MKMAKDDPFLEFAAYVCDAHVITMAEAIDDILEVLSRDKYVCDCHKKACPVCHMAYVARKTEKLLSQIRALWDQ